MACPGAGLAAAGGRTAPPSPESPCTCRASTAGRSSGPAQPGVTGVPAAPMNSHTASAFAVVLASPTLPATVVMPVSSMPGCPCANAIASASSIPGSQSRMILLGMSGFLAPLWCQERKVPNVLGACPRDRRPPGCVASSARRSVMHIPPITAVDSSDPEIARLIHDEARRQYEKARLIPSENYVSVAVLEASGSVLTNKYSEGYPTRRYYEGQQFIDPVETIARDRAKTLFGVDHANVQPYSGSPANLAVYLAFAQPGDTVMGMALPMGGHLTHGWSVSATGKWFRPVQYGVRHDTGRVDLDEVRDLAVKEHPKIIFCGGTAIPRTIDFPAFAAIAAEAGSVLVADIAHIAGLIAGGAHPSPVGHAGVITTTTHKTLRGPRGAMIMSKAEHAKDVDRAVFPGLQGGPHNHTTAAIAVALHEAAQPSFTKYAHQVVSNARALAAALLARGYNLVSGGTDNHLILMDLSEQGIGGKPAAKALDRAGIETNYNTVPFDPRKPFDPSGIRIGTPAITTRGLREEHMPQIAAWMDEVVVAATKDDEAVIERVAGNVRELLAGFPMPGFAPAP